MSNTETTNNKQKRFIIIALIALVVIAGFALFRNRTTASVAIEPVGEPAVVYTNKSQRGQLKPEATTSYPVAAGDTEVIISAEGHYPWRETVSTQTGSTTVVRPFLVPEQPRIINDIPNTAREQLTRQRVQPTKSATSSDQRVRVIANDNGNLISEWIGPRSTMPDHYSCQNESDRCGVAVYSQDDQEVIQVDFYPNRSDVAIFATASGVYAIEIDPTGRTQNFQPINDELANPRFLVTDEAILTGNDQQITISQM
jgi:hypothetical protein